MNNEIYLYMNISLIVIALIIIIISFLHPKFRKHTGKGYRVPTLFGVVSLSMAATMLVTGITRSLDYGIYISNKKINP
jgi:hypothetical protein